MKNVTNPQLKFYLLIAIFVIMIGTSLYLHSQYAQIRNVDEFAKNRYSPLLFVATYVALSFLPIPFAPAYFVAALIYPIGMASLLTFIGNIIFSTLIFGIVRGLGREYIGYLAKNSSTYKHFEKKFEQEAFLHIFLLRLFYVIPIEVVGVIAGASRVPFRTYFLATVLGNIPLVIFSSMLVRGGLENNRPIFTIAAIGMIIMIILPIALIPQIRKQLREKISN
jgi:uncharacterized membrane protein YdjX (TVP38/TMEM64 family)